MCSDVVDAAGATSTAKHSGGGFPSAGVFSGARGAVLLVSVFGCSARPSSSPLFGSLLGASISRGQCPCGVSWSTGRDFSRLHGERGTVLFGAVLALIRHPRRRSIRMPEPHLYLRDVGFVLQGIHGGGGSHGMDAQAGDRIREVEFAGGAPHDVARHGR